MGRQPRAGGSREAPLPRPRRPRPTDGHRIRPTIATPDGGAVPYQRIAELTFEDMAALQAGLGSEQGQAAINDIPRFASGGVTIVFAEID